MRGWNKGITLQSRNKFRLCGQITKIDDFKSFAKEYKEKATNGGFTNEEEKKNYQEKFESKKEKAKNAEKELVKVEKKPDVKSYIKYAKGFDIIEKNNTKKYKR